MTQSIKKAIYILLAGIMAVLFFLPSISHASYTYQGKTFDTFEEMQRYVVEYMRAWREVYGSAETAPQTSKPKKVTETTKVHIDVTTSRARDITGSGARLTGSVDYKRNDNVYVWFEYGLSPALLVQKTTPRALDYTYDGSAFNTKVQGLLPTRTYYYRAVASLKSGGVRYGEIKSFKTNVDYLQSNALVQAQTGSVKDIDEDRATLTGTVQLKKESIAYYWFIYGDSEDDLFMKSSPATFKKGDNKTLTHTVRKLDDSTKYYYRFVVQDVHGAISYGTVRSFTTRRDIEDEKPILKTLRAESIAKNTAVLGGTVDMNDFRDGKVFIVYGESRTSVSEVKTQYSKYTAIATRGDERQKIFLDDDLDTYKTYSVTVSGLDPKTTHYYAIGIEYKDAEDDRVLLLGTVTSFTTKN